MNLTYEDVYNDFLKYYPGLKDKVQRYEPCVRPVHKAVYIFIDNCRYYYGYGAKVLQPADIINERSILL